METSGHNWWLSLGAFDGAIAAVTLRWGPSGEVWDMGVRRQGQVAEERLRVTLKALGLAGARYVRTRQVHGSRVVAVTNHSALDTVGSDGLVTCEPGLALVTVHADCYPVFLIAPRAIGLLHVGWRGLLAGIVEEGLSAISKCGVSVEDLQVMFGPGIGPCCYTFAGPSQWEVARMFGYEVFQGDRLDLYRATAVQLLKNGVEPTSIGPRPLCTSCNGHLFFSYRREGECGRFAAIAALLER